MYNKRSVFSLALLNLFKRYPKIVVGMLFYMLCSGMRGKNENRHENQELRVAKPDTGGTGGSVRELSKGFISQLERDLTSPSIATLVDILQCLRTNLEEFLLIQSPEQVVFKSLIFRQKDSDLKK